MRIKDTQLFIYFSRYFEFQRVFWAFTEGATATALLVAGGNKGLTALQTVSIIMGLPYTIIVCFMCVSLYRLVRVSINYIFY